MPINPNIALGVQPIQQPNMLGQMGQIMAIRAAQQEMEGNENTRNYFAKPISERGDPSQLLGTKQGQAAYKALNEGQIKQLEAEQKRINLVGAGAGAVLENPTMETFTTVVSDLVNRGIYTPQQRDQAFATIGNDPSKIKAFVTPIFNQAISAEKRLSDITSRANAATAAGPGNRQATLAERIYEDKLKGGGDIVTTTVPDPENPKERIEIQARRDLSTGQLIPLEVAPMPMRVEISPNSATSAYQPLAGDGGTSNVLATQVAPQGGGAAAPIVNGLNPNAPQQQAPAGPTFARPKSKSENLTEAQGKATNFSIRAKQAHEVLNSVGEGGKVQPGLIKRGAEAIPFVGEALGTALNITQSDAQQQVEQAQRNFVNAVLRQESGAAINKDEFDNAKKQYFPQPGDSAAVIEQKRLNREAAIKGFDIAAGPGAKQATPPSTAPKRINSMDEYNSLPSGATYIDPEGTTRRKK